MSIAGAWHNAFAELDVLLFQPLAHAFDIGRGKGNVVEATGIVTEIGAGVTSLKSGDRKAVLGFLNSALATELVCVLRYRRHHFMARGLSSPRIAEEFLVHADEELSHADQIAEIDLNPVIARSDGPHIVDARIKVTPCEPQDPFLRKLR